MKISRFDLNDRPLLIAEMGNNHEGGRSLAMEMVAAAAEAGADAVKVQVINPSRLVNRSEIARLAQLSRFDLSLPVFHELAEEAHAKGLLFIASAFDEDSMTEIIKSVDGIKIASGDLDFYPLLLRAACTGKPMILSTWMGTLEEVRAAVEIISGGLPKERSLSDSLALLHCVSLYPAPLNEVNLRAMHTLSSVFGLTVGYSDHTLGTEVAAAALALGARIIEKHFTMDKSRISFRDHALSADPADLRRLAAMVRNFNSVLGTGEKVPSPAERQMAEVARRSIVAARDLPVGTVLSISDFDFLRPRKGLRPSCAQKFLGRTLRVPVKAYELLSENAIE